MKKVMIPYDFTEASQNALEYGVALAGYLSASVTLLHIHQVPVLSHEFGLEAYPIREITRDHEAALAGIAEALRRREPNLPLVECFCETGDPAELIVAFGKAHDIDLIITGIGGHGNVLVKNLIGSTSVDVARNTDKPVLIIPPDAHYRKVRHIAYACDYDPQLPDRSSLIRVKYINTLFDATLHVLHVVPENHELSPKESLIDHYVEQHLEQVCHKTYLIAENTVSDGLLYFVQHHDIDLVIIEPKKHSLLHKLFSFSTTNALAFYSPVPVLTIHG